VTIYRYGWIAVVWRVMVGLALAASVLLVLISVRLGEWTFLGIALPLTVPSLVLPWMLAVRIDTVGTDHIVVKNLWFVTRRISREALGPAKVKLTAQGALTHISAPRAWIPVRGTWPIYVDLNADIPDKAEFRQVLRIPRR